MDIDEGRIESLTEAVFEGRPVDWDAEIKLAPGPEHARIVRNLRRLHALASSNLQVAFGSQHGLPFHQWRHLRLLSLVGRGAQGELFRAWDETLGREVALKLFPEDGADSHRRSRLLEEARRLARIRSEHVVRIYGADVDHGRVGFWMEFVEGESLEAYLERLGPLDPVEVAHIGLALTQALGAAHRAGVVHGDVKTSNVVRQPHGTVRLVDFGAGITVQASEPQRKSIAGTPLYMAPETLRNGVLSEQSDIYELGVLLFHCLTGRYPVQGRDIEEIRTAHTQNERIALAQLRSDLPSALGGIVDGCLQPNPDRRFREAKEVETKIERYLDRERRRRHLSRGVAVVVGVIACVFVAWIGLARRTPTMSDNDAPEVTDTSNPQAGRLYRMGMDAYARRDFDTARVCFRDAVAYDSTYALAYYQWSVCEAFWETSDEAERLAATAVRHSGHASPENAEKIQRWYFLLTGRPEEALTLLQKRVTNAPRDAEAWYELGRMQWFHLGRTRDAIISYLRAIAIDPDYDLAFNDLAYCYNVVGNQDSAVACAARNIRLLPHEPNPYDTMGDVLLGHQPADSSAKYYRLALDRKANFVLCMEKLAAIAIYQAKFDSAAAYYQQMIDSDDAIYRAKGEIGQVGLKAFAGDFETALMLTQQTLARNRRELKTHSQIADKRAQRSHILRQLGNLEEAYADMVAASDSLAPEYHSTPDMLSFHEVQLLLDLGRRAEAAALIASLPSPIEEERSWVPMHGSPRLACEGILDLNEGRAAEAATKLGQARRLMRGGSFEINYLHALALLEAGEIEVSVREWQRILEVPRTSIVLNPIFAVKAWYHLGRGLELLDRPAEALQAYERFLSHWRKCRPRPAEVEDALQRVTHLTYSLARGDSE